MVSEVEVHKFLLRSKIEIKVHVYLVYFDIQKFQLKPKSFPFHGKYLIILTLMAVAHLKNKKLTL